MVFQVQKWYCFKNNNKKNIDSSHLEILTLVRFDPSMHVTGQAFSCKYFMKSDVFCICRTIFLISQFILSVVYRLLLLLIAFCPCEGNKYVLSQLHILWHHMIPPPHFFPHWLKHKVKKLKSETQPSPPGSQWAYKNVFMVTLGPEEPAGEPLYFVILLCHLKHFELFEELSFVTQRSRIIWRVFANLMEYKKRARSLAEESGPQYPDPLVLPIGRMRAKNHCRTALLCLFLAFFFLFIPNLLGSKISWVQTFLVYLHKKYRLWDSYLA